ncbi:MAG TPA: chemotaxis-specific protein-glutamate methyltransferase CheB [Gemmatimonadaceae bacterium]|nr:chemotaxis-specific protein-glutamate methyltransferase CheB [Gemmatimonadaceae bacterium]
MNRLIRVLVVDDSAFVRKVVTQMLSRSPFIEVVGTARNGQDALEQVERLQPNVVTLDLVMPVMDGVTFLREQMKRRPVAVIVCSITHETGAAALEALEAGAVDFVQKPTALATDRIFEIGDELVAKVKAAASVTLAPVAPVPAEPVVSKRTEAAGTHRFDIVVIGISTGGPQALRDLIPRLPKTFPVPIAIVLHMPIGYTLMYAKRLDEVSALEVVEAGEGDPVRPGMVFIAPAGRHLVLTRSSTGEPMTHLAMQPSDTPHRPAVDVLFRSAADVFGSRVLGIVMTGMGNDGLLGSAHIKALGGTIVTEAESSCVVYGMPRAVVEANLSDLSAPLAGMAAAIMERV